MTTTIDSTKALVEAGLIEPEPDEFTEWTGQQWDDFGRALVPNEFGTGGPNPYERPLAAFGLWSDEEREQDRFDRSVYDPPHID